MNIPRPIFFQDTSADRVVRIHNELLDRGPRLMVQLLSPHGKESVTNEALVDTGADITSFEESVIERLGYTPHGTVTIQTAAGKERRGIYLVRVAIPQRQREHRVLRVEVAGLGKINKNSAVPFALIGRDVLHQGSLSYNGPLGEFQLDLLPEASLASSLSALEPYLARTSSYELPRSGQQRTTSRSERDSLPAQGGDGVVRRIPILVVCLRWKRVLLRGT